MADTKIIKKRIKTAKNIAQITKAMEMVAASKMRRAQEQALSSRPYSDALRQILFSLLQNEAELDHSLMKPNGSPLIGVLLVSTDKGLCGGLNTNHFRSLRGFLSKYDPKNLRFFVTGKKGRDYLLKSSYQVLGDFPQFKENFIFEDTLPVSHFLINAYLRREVGKTFISFSNFVSTLSQKPKIVQVLPVRFEDLSKELGILEEVKAKTEEKLSKKEYLIEPDAKSISQWLLPYFVELVIYHYMLEAKAAEHSARMVAMKNASDNADEIMQELNLNYNKVRQMQITNQIADLATASMAIKK